jgi:hypothetical protein
MTKSRTEFKEEQNLHQDLSDESVDELMKDYDETHSNCCDALIQNGRCLLCKEMCK